MMQHSRMLKNMIRCGIIAAWVMIIVAFLYSTMPTWYASDDAGVIAHSDRELYILVWGDLFDPLYVRRFEEATGITVHMSSYDSNEELIVKLKGAEGRGYDLISPSDYAVKILRDEGLLQPLDRTKMPFYQDINPLLLGHDFDPDNNFSIPYEWEVYGIAYDKLFFAQRPIAHSWSMLFDDPHGLFRIIASSDALEMFRIAAHYLFGKVDELTEEQVIQVTALLRAQHGWVEAYTRTNLDYYLTAGYSPLAFASSAYVGRRKQFADTIGFFVPPEGGIVTIENLAIPIGSTKNDLVYTFLQFVYSRESMSHHFDLLTYYPATLNVAEPVVIDSEIRRLRTMTHEEFSRLIFVKQIMSEEQMNHLWVTVKS